jgi:hypothetical protein
MTRQVPAVLWIALIALAAISVAQLGAGIARGNGFVLVGVALNVLFGVGLYRGARWAFVLILLFGIAGSLVMLLRSPAYGLVVTALNAIVLVPVWLSHAYFFGPTRGIPTADVRYCPQCGRPNTAPPTPNCPACNPL